MFIGGFCRLVIEGPTHPPLVWVLCTCQTVFMLTSSGLHSLCIKVLSGDCLFVVVIVTVVVVSGGNKIAYT